MEAIHPKQRLIFSCKTSPPTIPYAYTSGLFAINIEAGKHEILPKSLLVFHRNFACFGCVDVEPHYLALLKIPTEVYTLYSQSTAVRYGHTSQTYPGTSLFIFNYVGRDSRFFTVVLSSLSH